MLERVVEAVPSAAVVFRTLVGMLERSDRIDYAVFSLLFRTLVGMLELFLETSKYAILLGFEPL